MADFFAIGLDEWSEACALGLNPAVSFLIMACGTGGDNSTTAWSATSVAKYAGIAWIRAEPAIDRLIEAGLVTRVPESSRTKPRYKLRLSQEKIWLPKSIVIPLADETPPLARIRQAQDVMTLRLFVELYHSQNLAADGGISRAVYFSRYKKATYCENGAHMFLGFDATGTCSTTWNTEVVRTHRITVSTSEKKAGRNEGSDFFDRMRTLDDLGFLEYSVCLFESDDKEAEMLFPVDGPTAEEKGVHACALEAGERVLQDWQYNNNGHEYLIPVLRHQSKAELVGIYRLRHRPHTRTTGAWWAILQEKVKQAKEGFDQIRR